MTAISSVSFEGMALVRGVPRLQPDRCDLVCGTAGPGGGAKRRGLRRAAPWPFPGAWPPSATNWARRSSTWARISAWTSEADYTRSGTAAPIRTRPSTKRPFTACRSFSGRRFAEEGHRQPGLLHHGGARWPWCPRLEAGLIERDGHHRRLPNPASPARGASLTQGTHYPELNESFTAYKVASPPPHPGD